MEYWYQKWEAKWHPYGGGQILISEIQAVVAGQRVDERAALEIVARARTDSKSDAYRLLQAEKSRKS